MKKKCTCGGDQVGFASHRSWCQLNKPMKSKKLEKLSRKMINEFLDALNRVPGFTPKDRYERYMDLQAVNQKEGK